MQHDHLARRFEQQAIRMLDLEDVSGDRSDNAARLWNDKRLTASGECRKIARLLRSERVEPATRALRAMELRRLLPRDLSAQLLSRP